MQKGDRLRVGLKEQETQAAEPVGGILLGAFPDLAVGARCLGLCCLLIWQPFRSKAVTGKILYQEPCTALGLDMSSRLSMYSICKTNPLGYPRRGRMAYQTTYSVMANTC